MQIEASANNIIINGNIKTINDFQNIKSSIDSVVTSGKTITIKIVDSISITSSVIGYLNKLVLKDGVNITMLVGNEKLIELLEDLNLKSTFNARKI